MRRLWPALILSVALGARGAAAQNAPAPSRSCSIGSPNSGRLENAVELRPAAYMVMQPTSSLFGTQELVGMVRRAAERLQQTDPGPRLLVGALSSRSGGRLTPHSSHQSGRDADLGLFYTDDEGSPVEAPRFLQLDQAGCGNDRGISYCLDANRTFRFIANMVEDPDARVQWILVAADLRQRILAAGRRMEVDPATQDRVVAVTEPRESSEDHRNHMHVRIYCPADDRPRCQDDAAYEPEAPRPTVRRRVHHRRRHHRHRRHHRRHRHRRHRRH